jgi:carboxyl-terminal processing protease
MTFAPVLSELICMIQKKTQVWLPLLLSVALIIGMFFGYQLKDNMGSYAPSFFGRSQRTSIQEILDLVKVKYVDTVNIDSLSLFAIDDILNQLDPHSVYLPPVKVQSMNEDMAGSFHGAGIEFGVFDDTVHVINVLPNGPADKAGIHTGDLIISANDSIVSGKKRTHENIRTFFRGPKGTAVKVQLLRSGQLKTVTIERGIIPIKSVEAAYMIENGVAYIGLNKFSTKTYEEFMENLERLQKEGMKKLILDLRGNGGGMLDDAVQIADEFLSGSKEIVYTEGKSSPRQDYAARRPGLFEEGKLIILIDEGSASASEVLAGALQDWDRATIIGRRSFGKGLVQEQFQLSNGSAVRLTVSRYFTPIGRSIQKPYEKGNLKHYRDEVMERYSNGEIFKGDSSAHNGKQYKTKGGRPVYGGGGISPDIYFAADTTSVLPSAASLYKEDFLYSSAYYYYLQNKNKLQQIKSPAELLQTVNNDAALWQMLVASAAKKKIAIDSFTPTQQQTIKLHFASMLGRQLWRSEGYLKIMNLNDPLIKRALQEVK